MLHSTFYFLLPYILHFPFYFLLLIGWSRFQNLPDIIRQPRIEPGEERIGCEEFHFLDREGERIVIRFPAPLHHPLHDLQAGRKLFIGACGDRFAAAVLTARRIGNRAALFFVFRYFSSSCGRRHRVECGRGFFFIPRYAAIGPGISPLKGSGSVFISMKRFCHFSVGTGLTELFPLISYF